ncbi:hypothetical protein ACKKBG_A09260 [Auxenochlorella protothecoides x Auxenochlorella symbiontica]
MRAAHRCPSTSSPMALQGSTSWTRHVEFSSSGLRTLPRRLPAFGAPRQHGKWQLNAQGRHSGRSEPQVPTAAAEQQSTPSNQILLDLQERRARRRQRFQEQQQKLQLKEGDDPEEPQEGSASAAPESAPPPSSLAMVVPSSGMEGVVPQPHAPSQGMRGTARVHFTLRFRTDWGQRLRIVGSQEGLGNWRLADGHNMKWTTGDNWVAEVDLPTGTVYEYKFVVVDHASGHALAWQSGNNSVLALRPEDRSVDVFDNWGGEPGAQLVADGAKPLTREQRLLSWATEMEASMVGQRQELRRARMELVAAQEDARKAREESKRMYARLAESEAARIAAATDLRAAETTNKVLMAQLNEVNTSFKSALETAADLLQAISTRPRPRRASAKAGTAVDADKAAAAAVGRGAGTPLGSAAGVAGGQVSEPTAEPAAEPAAGAASGPGTSTASKRKATVVTTTTPVPSPTNLSPAVPAPKPWGKGSAKA